jgi:hypothetical protein
MYPLTASDLNSIWKARLCLMNIEEALPKVPANCDLALAGVVPQQQPIAATALPSK